MPKFAFDATFRVIVEAADDGDAEVVLTDILGVPLAEDTVLFRQLHTFEDLQTCRVCGCTEDDGCEAGCWWIAENVCSECEEAAGLVVELVAEAVLSDV
jgi:hypothetical protein